MSSPSEKEILKAFPDLDHGKAKELAEKLAAAADSEEEGAADEAMEFANEALGGHGVEAIQGDDHFVDKFWRDTVLLYVNMGDTYDATVLYDTESAEFTIGSWGDFMEDWEKEDDDSEDSDEEEDEEADEEEAETEEVE